MGVIIVDDEDLEVRKAELQEILEHLGDVSEADCAHKMALTKAIEEYEAERKL